MTFHREFVHIVFRSVWVDDLPPFGKERLNQLIICSFCMLTICAFSYFLF